MWCPLGLTCAGSRMVVRMVVGAFIIVGSALQRPSPTANGAAVRTSTYLGAWSLRFTGLMFNSEVQGSKVLQIHAKVRLCRV